MQALSPAEQAPWQEIFGPYWPGPFACAPTAIRGPANAALPPPDLATTLRRASPERPRAVTAAPPFPPPIEPFPAVPVHEPADPVSGARQASEADDLPLIDLEG